MSLSGQVALWVMEVPEFEKDEEKCDICGSTVSIWTIVFDLSIMRPTVLYEDNAGPLDYATHNATSATEPTSLEGINLITSNFLRSHKRLHSTFLTYAVVCPKNCKHTLSM